MLFALQNTILDTKAVFAKQNHALYFAKHDFRCKNRAMQSKKHALYFANHDFRYKRRDLQIKEHAFAFQKQKCG